jgi:hypothetical protein
VPSIECPCGLGGACPEPALVIILASPSLPGFLQQPSHCCFCSVFPIHSACCSNQSSHLKHNLIFHLIPFSEPLVILHHPQDKFRAPWLVQPPLIFEPYFSYFSYLNSTCQGSSLCFYTGITSSSLKICLFLRLDWGYNACSNELPEFMYLSHFSHTPV